MKPEYEHYRNRGTPTTVVTVRLPDSMLPKAKMLAKAEGDRSISGLVVEGLARVFEDRQKDPDWLESLATQLEADLAEVRTMQAELRTSD